ncbi:SDR family NAD(P)-dependent oxidoreductase [Paenibacillus sp. V4I7]|uniref:SDR family NAD(P)-dependent oxidoreductase n=1 Tax=Paenibacillus sp. V4I7 TaxID=3042307 RepID=UPI00277D1FC1|nr:SDR family NAD(P)-dependent oxidoreductase [Paenibacillus sp. V4I7]MDQ0900240.1 NAD(P)-dependent dehydrogenase (short-subunit alcohol dehydrogenase family) [Paenibacillus sp. V4I7]
MLVNNAGIMHNADVLELTIEQFQRVISVNLGGAFLCSQIAALFSEGNRCSFGNRSKAAPSRQGRETGGYRGCLSILIQ